MKSIIRNILEIVKKYLQEINLQFGFYNLYLLKIWAEFWPSKSKLVNNNIQIILMFIIETKIYYFNNVIIYTKSIYKMYA